jgi:hypothetical protein
MKIPAGPAGPPAADGADVVADATAACRGIRTMSAEIRVSGTAGGQRLRGRLIAGLAEPDAVHLDAAAPFGESIFIFAAKGGRATLLLPRDDRVLEHGDPAAMLEAVTGVPLDPAALRLALTGCAGAGVSEPRRAGDRWRVLAADGAVHYFERAGRGGSWRLVVVLRPQADRPEWRAEYRDFLNGLPRTIRFVSREPGRFDLQLALSGVEINTPLPDEAFALRVPPGMAPISLDELRRSGPLADTGER